MASSTLTQMDPRSQQFRDWLHSPGFHKPLSTVLHHTSSPTAKQYAGRQTIVNIRKFHMKPVAQGGRGASDIMANAYACPDGTVFTGRPLSAGNWAHAYISRSKPEAEAWRAAGKDRLWFNRYGFGLETVADFDRERHTERGQWSYECAMQVLKTVHEEFDIPADMLFFHRDVADKSCPGNSLDRRQVRAELAALLGADAEELKVVYGKQIIDCAPQRVGNYITVDAKSLLTGIGLTLADAPGPTIHQNGRAYVGELDALLEGWSFTYRDTANGPRVYCKQTG